MINPSYKLSAIALAAALVAPAAQAALGDSFDWCSSPQQSSCHLNALGDSTWIVGGAGTTLSDFLPPVQGTANNKPSPIFGVISVTAFDQHGGGSTPSNWVALQIPEPETYALMLAGLGLVAFVARRRRQ